MGGPAGLRKWVGAEHWRCPPRAEGLSWTPLGTLAGWVHFPSPREACLGEPCSVWRGPSLEVGPQTSALWASASGQEGGWPVHPVVLQGELAIWGCLVLGEWALVGRRWSGARGRGGMTCCVTHPLDLCCLCVHVAPLLWCDCPEGSPLPSPTIALLAGPLCSGRWHSLLPSHASSGVGESGVASSAVEPQSVARHALVPSHHAASRFSALEDGWVPGPPIPSCF